MKGSGKNRRDGSPKKKRLEEYVRRTQRKEGGRERKQEGRIKKRGRVFVTIEESNKDEESFL